MDDKAAKNINQFFEDMLDEFTAMDDGHSPIISDYLAAYLIARKDNYIKCADNEGDE